MRRLRATGPSPLSKGVEVAVYKDQRVLPVKAGSISEELRSRPRSVVWKAVGEKPYKVPYSARDGFRASSTDLLTWCSFKLEAADSSVAEAMDTLHLEGEVLA